MTANPQTVAPITEAGTVEQAGAIGVGTRFWRRVLLVVAVLVLMFGVTFAFAWYRASSLATRFLADADKSYAAGKYLESLTGYEEWDPTTNRNVTRGGYMKVVKMWSDPRAWPRPAGVERAQARIDEVFNQRLTVADAENFIQANTGRQNPYLAEVYLRLGELYEKEGDVSSAREIYAEFEELFPGETELIARAKENLARVESK